VCILRERGQAEEAERLRVGELAEMLLAVRSPGDTDATVAARLDSIFSAETERVANAAVLAELLTPMLAEHLRPAATSQESAPVIATVAEPLVTTPPAKTPAPRTTAISITDFIDEMIAQEKPPPRSPRVVQRRAS
jgi:hypothetical protein